MKYQIEVTANEARQEVFSTLHAKCFGNYIITKNEAVMEFSNKKDYLRLLRIKGVKGLTRIPYDSSKDKKNLTGK